VFTATAEDVMVKAGETDAPAATVTEAGTTAAALLLASVTNAPPPGGAGPFSVTVLALVEAPPPIDDGESVTAATPGTITVKVAVTVLPL
jgi:hypothetical protein